MSNDSTTKVCRQCGIEKSLSEFSRDKYEADEHQRKCKACNREYCQDNRERIAVHKAEKYQENREFILQERKEYYWANREIVLCRVMTYYYSHRDKIAAYKRQYYIDHRERISIWRMEYNAKNKENRKQYNQQYWAENKEQLSLQSKNYRYSHRIEIAKSMADWQRNNPEKMMLYRHEYRARKNGAEGSHTTEETRYLFDFYCGLCYWCDAQLINPFTKEGEGRKSHLDHVIPLKRGGGNGLSNLVWACASCNCSKKDKLPSEWSGSNCKWIE